MVSHHQLLEDILVIGDAFSDDFIRPWRSSESPIHEYLFNEEYKSIYMVCIKLRWSWCVPKVISNPHSRESGT